MSQLRIIFYFLFLTVIILGCKEDTTQVSYSKNKDDIKAKNLLSPNEAFDLLAKDSLNYLPIQVSKKKIFEKEHIPNAQNIWRPDYAAYNDQPYGGLIASSGKLENLLQNLSFKKGKTLLLYDAKGNVDAFRFAWVLEVYGFDNFKIINGGLKYWKELELPTTKKFRTDFKKSNFQFEPRYDKSIIADFNEVNSAIGESDIILIDTREDYEYKGEPFIKNKEVLAHKKSAFNRGSIPSAIHMNWSTLADLKGDHRIKAERDLIHDLNKKGITKDKEIILYCQSGSRTSHSYYVMKHVLGFPKVKNYDGSWIEWSYKHSLDSNVPIQQLCNKERFEEMRDSLINLITKEEDK